MKNTFVNSLNNYEIIDVAMSTAGCDCCLSVSTEQIEWNKDDTLVIGDEDQKICIKNFGDCDVKEIGMDEWVVSGKDKYYFCAIK